MDYPMKTTIEIDCDPWTGMGRQQNYYDHICSICGLEPQPRISAWFGCWTWPVVWDSEEQQQKAENYLKELYSLGRVRYASW